ncbi:calpain-5 [Mytilus galloprovincialis]|uniref:Calpain-5 n=1 Tax=Mytilus galloprovincialis TaxID=29158 RepID=A0A8B6C4N4_MYTGA|nr:calpain-5 [Mytilus galloprovincialis]
MPFKLPFLSSTRKHKGQDYDKLKSDCRSKGNLFIDTEFPPDDRSVFHTQGKLAGVVWKRPKQICDNPKLFVEGASAGDVTQGRIGNCWFVSAASCLAQNKEIWHNVIPNYKEQDWNDDKPNDYQGIFYFRFWRYGEWLEVVIDDFLPTVNDELIFIHSQSKNEFWSALLEKAYAKLFGCYEALDGGDLGEALEDFTGGVSEQIDMVKLGVADNPEERATLYKKFGKEMDRNSLMAASIPALSSDEMESATSTGLVKGHAYGVTAVKNIHLENQTMFSRLFKSDNKIPMIRLRNPWGQGEWKGAFSDGSEEWNKIPEEEKKRVGLTFEEDGEFWMSFDDYCQNFVHTAVCRVVNTSMFSINKTWHEGSAHGEWKKPDRAGGCANNRDTFLQNPQFLFDIKDAEDDVMFHLLQKTIRGKEGSDNLTVGFTIIQVVDGYFVHFFAPEGMDPIPKDVLFILDISYSMFGTKIQQQRDAMDSILQDLYEGDRFNIMEFSTRANLWQKTLLSANTENKQKARHYVRKMKATGWTDINTAMLRGIEFLNSITSEGTSGNRMKLLVFLTDGQASKGEHNRDNILNNIDKKNIKGLPVFSLAFGNDADYEFVKKVAVKNKGVARKIFEDSDASLQIKGFYNEISSSSLQNVSFKYLDKNTDVTVNATKMNFDTFFNGKEIVIAGKLSDDNVQVLNLIVTGNGVDGHVELEVESDIKSRVPELTKVGDLEKITERIWAYLTIKQLLEKSIGETNEADKKKLNDKALEMSLKYKFVTPLTSMVVTKPDERDLGAYEENEDAGRMLNLIFIFNH